MKSQMRFKSIGIVISAALLVLASFSVNPAKAQTVLAAAVSTEAKPELKVKFLGSAGDYLVFELATQQNEETRSNLRIRNENGNELYSETVFRKNSVRKLKIAKDEAEKIEFVYATAKGDVKKVVEVKIKVQEAVEIKDISSL